MYVPQELKADQYAIRMGDRLRKRMGGHTVNAVDRSLDITARKRLTDAGRTARAKKLASPPLR